MLNDYQKKENEKFFIQVINTLRDGGIYAYPAIQEIFHKKGNKLTCNKKAYNHIKEIVTQEFLINNFECIIK